MHISNRVAPWLFFLALVLVYVSLSPLSTGGMGYASENLATTEQIVSRLVPFRQALMLQLIGHGTDLSSRCSACRSW
jgi:hypothetical protein